MGDVFDRHVIASILALALDEAWSEAQSLTSKVGLEGDQLVALCAGFFPDVSGMPPTRSASTLLRTPDEGCLLDLLQRCSTDRSVLQLWLAAMIARRAQLPNHLWQDLGLRDRGELSRLMQRHFRVLAQRNNQDMKWKKFLYRTICRDASYSLCTAPSCSVCCDFDQCFGDESGESRLARVRRTTEATGHTAR